MQKRLMIDRRKMLIAGNFLWVFLFFVLPVSTIAQDNKELLLQDLYGKSGLEKQVAQIPMLIQIGFDQAAAADDHFKALPRNVIDAMRTPIETIFAPTNIKKFVLGECREKLGIDGLKEVIEWLDSPLGRKLTHLEEVASTPEEYVAMQQFAMTLQGSPPLPERLEIIKRLDSEIKATESSVEVAINTQIAVAIAIITSLPKEQQPTYDKLIEAVDQNRPQLESAMRVQTIISLLYTYRNVKHDELNEYIEFASSPSGTAYHEAAISGLKRALIEGSYRWGESIVDILEKSKSKTEA